MRAVEQAIVLGEAADLWALLPTGLPEPFTTRDLAEALGRSIPFAQRVAYCLRLAGAARTPGRVDRRRAYVRTDPAPNPDPDPNPTGASG